MKLLLPSSSSFKICTLDEAFLPYPLKAKLSNMKTTRTHTNKHSHNFLSLKLILNSFLSDYMPSDSSDTVYRALPQLTMRHFWGRGASSEAGTQAKHVGALTLIPSTKRSPEHSWEQSLSTKLGVASRHQVSYGPKMEKRKIF